MVNKAKNLSDLSTPTGPRRQRSWLGSPASTPGGSPMRSPGQLTRQLSRQLSQKVRKQAKGCCVPRTRRRWILAMLASAVGMMIAAIYIGHEIQPLKKSLMTVMGNGEQLMTDAGSFGQLAVLSLWKARSKWDGDSWRPSEVLAPLRTSIPYIDFGASGPAVISSVALFFAACVARCSHHVFLFSKIFNGLAILCLGLYLLYGGGMIAAAMITEHNAFLVVWNGVRATCSASLPPLIKSEADARAALSSATSAINANSLSRQVTERLLDTQATFNFASHQLETYSAICDSLDRMPEEFKALLAPGVVGTILAIFGLSCAWGLCKSSGCFKQPDDGMESARVAPAPFDDAAVSPGQPAAVTPQKLSRSPSKFLANFFSSAEEEVRSAYKSRTQPDAAEAAEQDRVWRIGQAGGGWS